jgi:hypothetical protein
MQAADDEVLVPVNCGQELYDVVEVTDLRAGLSAARQRVLAMSLRYVRGRPTPAYEMRVRLEAV